MRLLLIAFAGLVALPLAAQQHGQHGQHADTGKSNAHHASRGTAKNHRHGVLPSGWRARPDRGDSSAAMARVAVVRGEYHFMAGPSAIFYDARKPAAGSYRARATFQQMSAPKSPESYGLLVAGRDLSGSTSEYLYFLVRGDGKFMVRHRATNGELHTLHDWTAHPAVRKQNAKGQATNALAIEAGPFGARFFANGTRVAQIPRADNLNTDGLVGVRINHNLDVHVRDFGVTGLRAARR